MVKTKNKKRNFADAVHMKKDQQNAKKTMNPFEVHINKEKLAVIGRKLKNDKGLPGVSRAKAIQKRKGTLLQEYKLQNKSNKFTDRRIGESNKAMTDEDKVIARFTAIRKRSQNRKSIFNLADDEVLTHKGHALSQIEKFDDPRSDDEDDEDDGRRGNLESRFVEDAHFGGGILKKTDKEGAKTHRELIDQLIAESKKRKAEKQQTKEVTLELTEKLDTEWKDLMPIVNKANTKEEEAAGAEKAPVDDYDKVMRGLRFEARGTVSDRLKTEDEIAKEEREQLETLEQQRLDRMRGIDEETAKKQTHRSADDLDDDFYYESDPDNTLSYNIEGEANVEIDARINGKTVGEENEDVEESDEGNKDGSGSEAESESEDDLSDLKAESSSESDQEEPQITPLEPLQETSMKNENDIREDLQKRKQKMEQARQELPFTFSIPESYEKLQNLFENYSTDHQAVILERMIKCNHPSLKEGNKESLSILFAYLLQYINDLGIEAVNETSIRKCFDVFSVLAPKLFELAQLNPENAHNSVLEVIKEKHEESKRKRKEFPGVEVLVFLKLVSLLFSTSDFKHQVVSPCFVFMEKMLNKCRANTKKSITYGLFLVTLILEYTTLSKRYFPAAITYLGGILHMSVPKVGVKLIKVRPPFKPISSELVLLESHEIPAQQKIAATDLIEGEIDEDFKVSCISTTVQLIQDFVHVYKEIPSRVEIFHDISVYLQLLPTKNYPRKIAGMIDNLRESLEAQKNDRRLEFIVMAARKPKALRLYEPKIVEVFDGKRRKVQSREKTERDKLLHKLKKETKGALREIRRDKSFLAKVKIKQQIKSDKERRDKVKRIYAEASIQQSELNAMDRKKKK